MTELQLKLISLILLALILLLSGVGWHSLKFFWLMFLFGGCLWIISGGIVDLLIERQIERIARQRKMH